MKVTVEKSTLLAKLVENRIQHVERDEAAIEGYRTKAIEVLSLGIQQLQAGKLPGPYAELPSRPTNHTTEYDQAIGMLEMLVEETLEIGSKDYARFVQDEWDWSQHFGQVTGLYLED